MPSFPIDHLDIVQYSFSGILLISTRNLINRLNNRAVHASSTFEKKFVRYDFHLTIKQLFSTEKGQNDELIMLVFAVCSTLSDYDYRMAALRFFFGRI